MLKRLEFSHCKGKNLQWGLAHKANVSQDSPSWRFFGVKNNVRLSTFDRAIRGNVYSQNGKESGDKKTKSEKG